MNAPALLNRFLRWAGEESCLRLAILIGSRIPEGHADDLSDYDISLFGDLESLSSSDAWLDAIAPHWICIHEQFPWDEVSVPTRLVLFRCGTKMDFALHPLSLLQAMIAKGQLRSAYQVGYRILIDKDEWTGQLPPAPGTAYQLSFPNEREFREAVEEFWFEAYHVAKYLRRGDWWVAKVREESMRKWMLHMLQWSAMVRKGKPIHPGPDGKRLLSWMPEDDYRRLESCFSGWDAGLAGQALQNCLSLFRDASIITASSLGFSLDESREDEMEEYIQQLLEKVS